MRIAALTWLWTAAASAAEDGDHQHRPDPLGVQREGLRERGRDQQLDARPRDLQQPRGVLAQPVAEALVGEVDQRQDPPLLDQVADPAPQRRRRVHPGRVVARAVEQHDVARRGGPERGEHRVLVDPPAGRVGVGVRADPEPRGVEQLRVVGPGRLAHPQRLRGAGLAQEIRRHAQPAGAARRLRRERPAGRDGLVIGAQHEGADEVAIGGLAVDRPVELGAGGVGEPSLGLEDRRQHRRRPRLVHEHARRQVDLPGAAVVAVGVGEAEDRVGRRRDSGERRQGHGHLGRCVTGLAALTIRRGSPPPPPGSRRTRTRPGE